MLKRLYIVLYEKKKNGQREIQEATGNQTKKSFYPPQQTCPFCWYSLWKHSRQLTGLSGGPFLRDGSSFQGCTCSGEQQSLINLSISCIHRDCVGIPLVLSCTSKNTYQTFHNWCSVFSHMRLDGPGFDVVIDLDMRLRYWKLYSDHFQQAH